MPTLEIEGKQIQVDDSFLKLSPEQQNATVDEIAQSLKIAAAPKFDKNDPRFSPASMAGEKFMEGVPILGAYVPQIGAAISAAAHPITGAGSNGDTFEERRAKNIEQEKAASETVDRDNPVLSTVAKVGGGIASTVPLVMAAPAAFGAVGTLPQMMTRGALSGGALSAADAAARGHDPVEGGEIGAAMGAAAPVAGRAIGKVVSAIRNRGVPSEPLNTARVADVDIPVPNDDPAVAARVEMMRRGAAGDPAQRVIQGADELRDARIAQASENIGASLDQAGGKARTLPQSAAERVSSELGALEQSRFQTEQAAAARAAEAGEDARVGLVRAPVSPDALDPYSAAEQISGGVAARRGAAMAKTKDLYGRRDNVEGTFDPSFPQGLADDLLARLNSGENPLWIDPQTTSKANQVLRLVDETIGNQGLFRNNAANVSRETSALGDLAGPEAAAAAAPSEAEMAAAELSRLGVNPKRAREAVAKLPGADGVADITAPHSVAVPGGGSVDVVPRVVEAKSLRTSADPGYDPALQPRDRARAASATQINEIAKRLNPRRLGISTEADRGAPIVGPDGMVESGNGRAQAIRQVYATNPAKAEEYRQFLRSQGLDVSAFKEPVLIRERTTEMTPQQRKQFTVAANQSSTLSFSAAERALNDAKALPPETLSMIRNAGDLGAVENRNFVRSFVGALPAEERAAMMTAKGDLSSEGLTRIRNAVLARAYGDNPVLTRVAEATSDDIKSISRALTDAAPEWAKMRAAIASGRVPAEFDQTSALLDAVSRTAAVRGRGATMESGFAQADAFARRTPESESFQRMFYDADGTRAASSQKISDGLRHYAQEAMKVDSAPGLDLGLAPVKPADVLSVSSKSIGSPGQLSKDVVEATEQTAREVLDAEGPRLSLRDLDQGRKRIVEFYKDAKSAALASGDRSDLRAIGRILHEFDNAIIDAIDSGKFSGDGELAKRLMKESRASHAAYRETFTSRGPGDEIGRAVEKIVGRYSDSASTPPEIAALAYGPANDPGGAKAIKIAQRLRGILGETSPEWGAYKQGLFARITQVEPGQSARSMGETADRIDRFLTGTNGRGLSQIVFSKAERDRLAGYAQQLRSAEPTPINKLSDVEKIVARISGRDGGIPASTTEVIDYLYGRTGAGSKGLSVRLAQRLKQNLSPEGFDEVRQGMWTKLTEAGEGKTEWGPQKVSQRLYEFLNESGKPLANVLFSPAERAEMLKFADALKANVPPPGTTNPSGTAPMMARIGSRILHTVLPIAGLAHGGIPGGLAGYFLDRGLTAAGNANAARQAQRLVYGSRPSAPVDPRFAQGAVLIGQGARPAIAGNR